MKSIDIFRIIKKSIYNFLFKLEFKSYINYSENKNKIIDKNNYFFVLDLSSFTPNFDVTKNLIYLAISETLFFLYTNVSLSLYLSFSKIISFIFVRKFKIGL